VPESSDQVPPTDFSRHGTPMHLHFIDDFEPAVKAGVQAGYAEAPR
jgi:hypothetical protein